jgi:FAD synthetase
MATDATAGPQAGRRVLCCGTFDHLHPGHVHFLRQAAALGDQLYVVIARDSNVEALKGRRPDHGEDERLRRVKALGIAANVRLGHPSSDLLRVVAEIAPAVIALGYDQQAPPGLAEAFPGCRIRRLRSYHPDRYKSSLLRRRHGAP